MMAALMVVCCETASACIWDADTMFEEKWKNPAMAKAILSNDPVQIDEHTLRSRIASLIKNPHKDDPSWWNDLAGAHLRLRESREAINILEPLLQRFPDNYGIHANLGTAYHLAGQYLKAEREIARDLELNPDAHFGLEKYHLALLQYLVRDQSYQTAHLYVDEFSEEFVFRPGIWMQRPQAGLLTTLDPNEADNTARNDLQKWLKAPGDLFELHQILRRVQRSDRSPAYRLKWNLATDPKLIEGVLYMAELNRSEPAAMTMLGLVCLKKRDLNLAAAAFERAAQMKSPQTPILNERVAAIHRHIAQAQLDRLPLYLFAIVLLVLGVLLVWKIFVGVREWMARR